MAPKSELAKLRQQMAKQQRDIRSGLETNLRQATKTRRQIARLLTKANQQAKS